MDSKTLMVEDDELWPLTSTSESTTAAHKHRPPLCVEAEINCPPEDVGGVWGYSEFLEALADPNHEQHEDFVDWGGEFDSEKFDAVTTTKAMRRGLPDWRQM